MSDDFITRDTAKALKKEALQILRASLEETQTQHPLDIKCIYNSDRPVLGSKVPVSLYRSVRLHAFREVLGNKISSVLLEVAGRSVGRKLNIGSVENLIKTIKDFSLGNPVIEYRDDNKLTINVLECATCAGVPAIGEPLCHFESGIIAGGLEGVLGKSVRAIETRCWGLGDKICTWEASTVTDEDATPSETLESVMALVTTTALTIDGAAAIRRKNRELREAYRKLSELERLKRDLTDMVVHDLRMPLTTAIGSIETLGDISGKKLTEQENELLAMAISSGHVLLHMINDLLDVSKLEDHKLNLRKSRVAAAALVQDALHQVRLTAHKKQLMLSSSVPDDVPLLTVDKDRIVRVLVNLLSNAIRHTPPDGKIHVEVSYDCLGQTVNFAVSDTGEGILPEYHERIFDKFIQLESQKHRRRASTGLGLTFCKLITEAHDGQICVVSKPGCGSTFQITVPMK